MCWWLSRSKAAARSASSTHSRLASLRTAVVWIATIASWQPRPGRKPYDLGSNRASHSGSSAFSARACSALSPITGIPSPRRRPLLLGTYTRLTGRGLHTAAPRCSQAAISAFSQPASTMRPSTPAVRRPALISVTRRTLTRALLRERSISFCRLRTLARSPACDAAKIRRLSRRTCSSAWPQSTLVPVQAIVLRSVHLIGVQLVPRFGRPDDLVPAGSPDPRQRPFRPGSSPIRPVMREPLAEEPAPGSRFPAAFRPPAFASRVFLRPLGDSAFLTVGLPADTSRTPSGLSRSACDRYGRGGRPLNPGDSGALPAGQIPPAGTRRLPAAGPCSPA